MTRYYIEAVGTKLMETKFNRLGRSAVRARPAMRRVAMILFGIERATFNSQGRRGGGSWKNISSDWLNRKIREGLDPRILHARHLLRNSLSEPGAAHQQLLIGDTRVVLGTDLPYAARQNRERPFAKITKKDELLMRAVVREHLMQAWRRGR